MSDATGTALNDGFEFVAAEPGMQLAVRRSGKGPTVLLIGGLGMPSITWDVCGLPQWIGTTRSTPFSRTMFARDCAHSTGSYLGLGVRNVFLTGEENLVIGKSIESAVSTLCPAAPIKRAKWSAKNDRPKVISTVFPLTFGHRTSSREQA